MAEVSPATRLAYGNARASMGDDEDAGNDDFELADCSESVQALVRTIRKTKDKRPRSSVMLRMLGVGGEEHHRSGFLHYLGSREVSDSAAVMEELTYLGVEELCELFALELKTELFIHDMHCEPDSDVVSDMLYTIVIVVRATLKRERALRFVDPFKAEEHKELAERLQMLAAFLVKNTSELTAPEIKTKAVAFADNPLAWLQMRLERLFTCAFLESKQKPEGHVDITALHGANRGAKGSPAPQEAFARPNGQCQAEHRQR